MKRARPLPSALLALVAAAGVQAATPPAGDGRPPRPPVDLVLDANGDEVIDAAEIANASAALKKLDADRDGKLTREELLPKRPDGAAKAGDDGRLPERGNASGGETRPKRQAPPIVTALDANGDGVIDAKELAGAPARLKKLDADSDGRLSPREYRPTRPEGGAAAPPPRQGPGMPQ